MKFGRTYSLKIDDINGDTVTINYPLTLFFRIVANTFSSVPSAHFVIYNLKQDTRNRIFKDRYTSPVYRKITFQAGYEKEPKLPIVFQGNYSVASSQRQGTDWLTTIEAYSGLWPAQNSYFSLSIPAGYDLRDVILKVIRSMGNVSVGAVGTFKSSAARAISLNGSSLDILNQLASGGDVFIDNEKVYVLNRNEYVRLLDQIDLISTETGLIGTPRRSDYVTDVTMLFEPRARVGQLANLASSEKIFNGPHKVIGVNHSGIISGAVCGDALTILNLFRGTQSLELVKNAA